MSSVYNLRNRKSRQSCSCYLRNDLNLNSINPKVRLERHKILDSHGGKCSFIVEGSKILHKVDKQKSCNKIKVFVFLCVIFVLLTFISMEGYCMFESHNNVTEYYKIVSRSAETMLKGIKRIFHHPVKDSVKKQIRINQMNLDDNEVKAVKNIENKIVQDHLKKFLKIEDTKEAFLSDLYKNLLQQNDSTLVSTKNTCTKDEKYIDFYPLTDYALESQGAKILSIFDTEPYEEVTFNIFVNEFQIKNLLLTKFFCNKCPMLVLKAWTGPGDCWAFKGAKGQILIGLSKSIVISAITIDHIRHRNYTIQSAPKQFSVFGVSERNHAEGSGIFLGTFEYKTSGPEVQTFLILPPVEIAFEMVRFKFESNHGNKDYTCVYKIRVHGSPLKVN